MSARSQVFRIGMLVLLLPGSVLAATQWNDAGVPIWTGYVTPGYTCPSCPPAYACSMVHDGQGGTIFAWFDAQFVHVQRLDVLGNPSWAVNGIQLSSSGVSGMVAPGLAADGSGGAIVMWLDDRNGDPTHVYAQRVDGGGVVQWIAGGVRLCSSPATEFYPTIVSDGAGGAIVAWQDGRGSDSQADIYAMRVTISGSRATGWPDTGVALSRAGGFQQQPFAIPDGAGGAIVGWGDGRTSGDFDIYAQHVSADGSLVSGWSADGNPVCATTGYQIAGAIAGDGSGGAYFVWVDTRLEGYGDIFAQRMTGAGTPVWTIDGVAVTQSDGRGQYHPAAAADGSGGVLLGWEDAISSNQQDVYAQRLNGSGTMQWDAGGVPVCTEPAYQYDARIIGDGAGGAVLVWVDWRVGSSTPYLFAQHVGPAGSTTWANDGVRVCSSDVGQNFPIVLSEGAGVTLVGWSDRRPGLYAGRIRADGTVPVVVSLQDFDATPDHVMLVWYDALGRIPAATVQRSMDPSGLWSDLGQVSHNGNQLRYTDRDVVPGARYGYRLSIPGSEGSEFTVPTWIDVPRLSGLVLDGSLTNPARENIRVGFSLPDALPARLEVVDVNGRRWLTREVGLLGPGHHVVRLDDSRRLTPGVYQVRLVHGERDRVAPLVVIQ